MDRLMPVAERIGARLTANGHKLAVAESAAGGLISAALLAVPGASAYYAGGGIIYTRDARRALLGLAGGDITLRAATEDYARLVAGAVRDRLGVTWGLGERGASGPTGNSYGDGPGHVCIAVSGPVEKAVTLETGLDDRRENMWRFAEAALELLDSALGE